MLARADPLSEEMIPDAWRSAAVVHLAPIADEIDPALAGHLKGGLLGITAQGWLRRWDASGEVQPRPGGWASQGLSAADAVIVSLDDLGGDEVAIEEMAGVCRLLVVTEGPHGCRVHWNGDVRRVPVSPRTEVDPTGAGDIFAAAYFCRIAQHARSLGSGPLRQPARPPPPSLDRAGDPDAHRPAKGAVCLAEHPEGRRASRSPRGGARRGPDARGPNGVSG